MKLKIYHINAFTQRLTGGNPACVIRLDKWLPDSTMLAIAKENAVAETAFFVELEDHIHLRWFTPDIEIRQWDVTVNVVCSYEFYNSHRRDTPFCR